MPVYTPRLFEHFVSKSSPLILYPILIYFVIVIIEDPPLMDQTNQNSKLQK